MHPLSPIKMFPGHSTMVFMLSFGPESMSKDSMAFFWTYHKLLCGTGKIDIDSY